MSYECEEIMSDEPEEIRKDASRYRLLRGRFNATKTSEAQRVMEDLRLIGDPADCLDVIVDATIADDNA